MASKFLILVDTALKSCSECSCIIYTLRFFAPFCLVSSSFSIFETISILEIIGEI